MTCVHDGVCVMCVRGAVFGVQMCERVCAQTVLLGCTNGSREQAEHRLERAWRACARGTGSLLQGPGCPPPGPPWRGLAGGEGLPLLLSPSSMAHEHGLPA